MENVAGSLMVTLLLGTVLAAGTALLMALLPGDDAGHPRPGRPWRAARPRGKAFAMGTGCRF